MLEARTVGAALGLGVMTAGVSALPVGAPRAAAAQAGATPSSPMPTAA